MGWPAIGSSAVCALAGLIMNNRGLMIAAGVIAIPFCAYALPVTPIVLGCYFGAAHALKKDRQWLASALVVPVFVIYAVLAHTVLNQPDPSKSPHAGWQAQGAIRKN
jgi:hypothetical protein